MLCTTVNIDANGDSTVTPTEVRDAYNTARYFVNLINASELSYHVDFIYERAADLWVDEIVGMNRHLTVAWSNTFKALLVAVAVISLLLVVFYRFGALSIGTVSITSVFTGICVLVLLNAEFSIAAMVGLCAIAVSALASGIIYLNKFKEEAYRGRSVKKANTEAFKKAILPIVDIHVALVIIGALNWLLVGLFTFNLVDAIFGVESVLSRIIYVLVGISGIWSVAFYSKLDD